MTMRRKHGIAQGDYGVGYGRPPVEGRFRKGESGNPRGRPKGVGSLAQLLSEKFARRVTVQENGKSRQMRVLEVLVQKLINDAARGNLRAMRLLLDLWQRYGEAADANVAVADLTAADRAIIAAYLQKERLETRGEDASSASSGGAAAAGEAADAQAGEKDKDGGGNG